MIIIKMIADVIFLLLLLLVLWGEVKDVYSLWLSSLVVGGDG